MKQELLMGGIEPKKIRLGSYPYTFVRVTVMSSLLLKQEDYQRLLKMDLPEIAKFLQETQYRKEVDAFGVDYGGMELIELALDHNLAFVLQKLKQISYYGLRQVIDQYHLRWDIWNIKAILRSKTVQCSVKEVFDMLVPVGFLNKEKLKILIEKDSVEEILKSLPIIPFDIFTEGLRVFSEEKNLMEIENALDSWYYGRMVTLIESLRGQGKRFKEFLKTEIEVRNILTMVRLKRENMPKEKLEKYIFFFKGTSVDETMFNERFKKFLGAKDLEELMELLVKDSKCKDAIKKGWQSFQEKKSLMPLEIELQKHLLKTSSLLRHQNPLSVDVILGFMFAKEIEIKNIKTIAKAKLLGFDEKFIESQIII